MRSSDKEQPNSLTELVKHGKWVEHHEPFTWMGYTTWTCSECGYEVGYEQGIKNRTNYCPNCGANMRPQKEIHYIPVPEWLKEEAEKWVIEL